jgi:hypothetical protein|tara:strand:+ start:91 stop:564 length:474 start_codon:yes stop_codon:yes gene_type:complete
MIEQIYNYFTFETIYLWLNIGVIPFWLILIIFPESKISNFFVISIFPMLILSITYSYVLYNVLINEYNFLINFRLYLSMKDLSELFLDKNFILLFWTHFLSINLFCGGWIVNDYQKFEISKFIMSLPLIITYFIGPLGIFIYWIIKIFFSKKINLYE